MFLGLIRKSNKSHTFAAIKPNPMKNLQFVFLFVLVGMAVACTKEQTYDNGPVRYIEQEVGVFDDFTDGVFAVTDARTIIYRDTSKIGIDYNFGIVRFFEPGSYQSIWRAAADSVRMNHYRYVARPGGFGIEYTYEIDEPEAQQQGPLAFEDTLVWSVKTGDKGYMPDFTATVLADFPAPFTTNDMPEFVNLSKPFTIEMDPADAKNIEADSILVIVTDSLTAASYRFVTLDNPRATFYPEDLPEFTPGVGMIQMVAMNAEYRMVGDRKFVFLSQRAYQHSIRFY